MAGKCQPTSKTNRRWQAERATATVRPGSFGSVQHMIIMSRPLTKRARQELALQLSRLGCNEGFARITDSVGHDVCSKIFRQSNEVYTDFQHAITQVCK